MGLFDKKTDAEKEQKEKIKEVKKDAARRKGIPARTHGRKRDARQDAREEKKDAREEKRDEKKDAREEKRDEMKDIRQSDLKGEAKRDAKSGVREEKRDAIGDAKDDKRDTIDLAVDERKDRIDDAKDAKKVTLDSIRTQEIQDLAALNVPGTSVLDATLALELLALTHVAQFSDAATLTANPEVRSTLFGKTALVLVARSAGAQPQRHHRQELQKRHRVFRCAQRRWRRGRGFPRIGNQVL